MRDRRLPRLLTIATGTRHDFFAALLACRESALGTSGGSCGKKRSSQLGATPESREPLPIVSHLSVGSHLVQSQQVADGD